MPYRVRPIRWDLMVAPQMAGLSMEARASENLGQSILGGLASVGQGIVRDRMEKESRRRFDAQQAMDAQRLALSEEGLQLRAAGMLLEQDSRMEALRERQANASFALDALEHLTGQTIEEAQTQGQVSPRTSEAMETLTRIAGGPTRAQQAMDRRAAISLRPG